MRIPLMLLVLSASTLLTGCATAGNTNTSGANVANSLSTVNRNSANMNTTQTPSAGTTGLADADRKFIGNAAQGGKAEVEMGRLASQKAQNQAVKDFGKQMVEDHTKANNELKALAATKSWTLPSSVSPEQESTMNRLSKLSGAAFDRAYADDMIKDHEDDVKEFQDESNSAKDGDLKAFATKTLPVLERHLKMAREMSGSLKP